MKVQNTTNQEELKIKKYKLIKALEWAIINNDVEFAKVCSKELKKVLDKMSNNK